MSKTYSGFLQLNWAVLDDVEIAGGARYTRQDQSASFGVTQANPLFAPRLTPVGKILQGAATENNLSPEATVSWHIKPHTMVYGAYKTGWLAGGYSEPSILTANFTSGNSLLYGAEKVKGGEIGVKAQLLDNTLRLTGDIYRYDYNNLQLNNFIAATISNQILNAGSSYTQGVELQGIWRATPELTLHGGLSFSQGRYSSFPNIACYSGQTAALGCSPVTGFQDLSGKPLARAPDWTGAFGVSYERPAFDNWFIGLTADVRFSSGYFTQVSDSIYAYQDTYYILNTSARLFTEDKRWELALIAKDLNDKQYATESFDVPSSAPGTIAAQISRPRQIIIQATYHFGESTNNRPSYR